MKVLVVDDSETVRVMVRNILQQMDISVLEAADGEEALQFLKGEHGIQFILLDWEMPVMDGMEFLLKVRNERLAESTKIIMLTTYTKRLNILKAIDAGADEYIMKPFTSDIIIEKMQSLVDTY